MHTQRMESREAESKLTYAVVYMDDGPGRPCAQSGSVTSAHTRVYLFDTEAEMREWLDKNYSKLPKRKRSRVTCCYPKGHTNYTPENGLEWPAKH